MTTATVDRSGEPYVPQDGTHWFSERPPFCENTGDPHIGGYCTGHLGQLQTEQYDICAHVARGVPGLYLAARKDGEDADLQLTPQQCRQLAALLTTLAEWATRRRRSSTRRSATWWNFSGRSTSNGRPAVPDRARAYYSSRWPRPRWSGPSSCP